jgi:hypothetical protein
MKQMQKVRTTVCTVLCLASGNAFAGTYAVPGQYATIQDAINAASSNSVINVAPGVYRETLNFGTKMMIAVNGTGGAAATVIDGGGASPLVIVGRNNQMQGMAVVISGFTLQNGYSSTSGGVTNLAAGSLLSIKDCIVKNNIAGSGGAFAVSGGTLLVQNSLIANNTATNAGGAVYASSGTINLVNDTISANVAAEGSSISQLYGATVGGLNNIIYGNTNSDGTAGYPVYFDQATAKIMYSVVEGNPATSVSYANIDANPGFADASSGNYQLTAGSPAVDSIGMNNLSTLSPTPVKDLLGVVRPQGTKIDLGAYEFVAPNSPPVNGTCGSSNGALFSVAPTANLCATGTATAVTGIGPFSWSCAGSNGGTPATCSAQLVDPSDVVPPTAVSVVATGTTANNSSIKVTFSENVIAAQSLSAVIKVGTFRTLSTVSGSVLTIRFDQVRLIMGTEYILTIPAGTFRDAAGNLNVIISVPVTFGTVAPPPPPAPVNGVCGSANGSFFAVAPAANLCTTGTASAVSGTGPFAWSCAGSNGGTTASCQALLSNPADVLPPAAVSIVATGTTANNSSIKVMFTEDVIATRALSSVITVGPFKTSVSVSGSAVTIKFNQARLVMGTEYILTIPAGSFRDSAGNLNALISAPVTFGTVAPPPPPAPVNGVCGSANNSFFSVAPTANLCTTGTASAASGSGPFSWSCAGSNGGTTASCSANFSNPVDVVPPAVVSIVASGTTANNSTVTVMFSENIFAVAALSSVVKVGSFRTVPRISGSVLTVRFDQIKLVMGTEYMLTIPAGSLKDASGNLNALITAPVTFGTAAP